MLVTESLNDQTEQRFTEPENFLKISEESVKSGYGWSEEQLEFLKENYLNLSYPEIAKAIGKKSVAVSVKASRLGLVKPDTGNKGQFRKNHTLTPSSQNLTIKRVPKGDSVVMRIKIGKSWIPYHRYVWEQANGAITEGMNIYFKDNNPENCELSNLEMLKPCDGLVKRQPTTAERSKTAQRWWNEKRGFDADFVPQPKPVTVKAQKAERKKRGVALEESFKDSNMVEKVYTKLPSATHNIGNDSFYDDMKERGYVMVRDEDGKTIRWVRPEKLGLPPVQAVKPMPKPAAIIIEADEFDEDFDINQEVLDGIESLFNDDNY